MRGGRKYSSGIIKSANRLLKAISGRRERFYVALGATVIMLLLTFICDNIPHSFGNEDLMMKNLRLATRLAGHDTQPVPDHILAVNIGYDRQLTPVTDEYGIPCGEIDVTDRHKLLEFLNRIKDADYSAIALDVFFDKTMPAVGDSALFACINSMDRLVVPAHADAEVNPAIDKNKIVNGDYSINLLSNNFTKYRYRNSGAKPSMAAGLHMISSGKKSLPLYERNTIILPLPIELESQYTQDGDKEWYNLGADILDSTTDEELRALVAGKTIVIGDYCLNDIHDSYAGNISGPAIVINALEALRKGHTRINPWSTLITVLFYFLITWFLITGMTVWKLIGWQPRPITNFILSFIGFSVVLSLLQILHFIVFTEFHDTMLVTLFLSFYSIFCQKLNDRYEYTGILKPKINAKIDKYTNIPDS